MWLDKYVDVDAAHLYDFPANEINVIEYSMKVAATELNHDYFSYDYNPLARKTTNNITVELLELLQDNGFKFVAVPNGTLRVYFDRKKAKELYSNAR